MVELSRPYIADYLVWKCSPKRDNGDVVILLCLIFRPIYVISVFRCYVTIWSVTLGHSPPAHITVTYEIRIHPRPLGPTRDVPYTDISSTPH